MHNDDDDDDDDDDNDNDYVYETHDKVPHQRQHVSAS